MKYKVSAQFLMTSGEKKDIEWIEENATRSDGTVLTIDELSLALRKVFAKMIEQKKVFSAEVTAGGVVLVAMGKIDSVSLTLKEISKPKAKPKTKPKTTKEKVVKDNE